METHVCFGCLKKECLVIFNVLTLHILTYEASWTVSLVDIMGGLGALGFRGVRTPLPWNMSCSSQYIIVNITV